MPSGSGSTAPSTSAPSPSLYWSAGARGDLARSQFALERAADGLVEGDPVTPRPCDDLDCAVTPLRADVERAPAHQRIERNLCEVQEHLDRGLGQAGIGDRPVDLDLLGIARQRIDHRLGLVHRDCLAKAARCAECEAEELQFVGADLRRLLQQLDHLRAHVRVFLVGEQFKPVGERAHRREHVVAQARAQHRGEIGLGNHEAFLTARQA
jgi:hypothetical protein